MSFLIGRQGNGMTCFLAIKDVAGLRIYFEIMIFFN